MDYHASTPVDPRVLEAMLPYFSEKFGNSASKQHSFGWEAEAAVEKAREQVARFIGAQAGEIYFTSGATESNHLALRGFFDACAGKPAHFMTSAIEHSSVREMAKHFSQKGIQVSVLPVDEGGQVDLEKLKKEIGRETLLLSLIMANNEIGTLQAMAEIGKICKEKEVLFHTDAAQAAGKVLLNVQEMNIDLLSLSAHKNYGPKGVGALYVRSKNPRIKLEPLFYGGGHERGLRSGTLNVPGIVGMGRAFEISSHEMKQESEALRIERDRLQNMLSEKIPGLKINGSLQQRLPHNLNVSIPGVSSDRLMMNLKKEVALSSGSACASASPQASHVLKAIGLSDEMAACSLRFGLGRFSKPEEIDFVAKRVVEEVFKIRGCF